MLNRTLSTTLLQILCKSILNSIVIAKSVSDPDDDFFKNTHYPRQLVNGSLKYRAEKCNFDYRHFSFSA